eukprot:5693300-Karenia_brevis.AAC.1
MYCVLLISGIPHGILLAYVHFQESTMIHNSISGSLGQGHKHHCGVPQGCPLSMLFISLYLRPWMAQMLSLNAVPRTLADDLMLITRGSRALHVFQRAFELTMEHLIDLGGRLAPRKSKIFSTLASHRTYLAAYVWPPIAQQIKVVPNLRDLGSALSLTAASCTSYSQVRLTDAINTLHRIRRLPHSKVVKGRFALSAAHAKGLYSCEASQVDIGMLRKYTSTLMKLVGTDNQMHA